MNKLLISAAVAAAFTMPAAALAANAIFFDRSGSGAIPGERMDQWAWQAGEAICDNCTTFLLGGNPIAGTATLVVQAALAGMTLAGNNANTVGTTTGISYQLSIPVTTGRVGIGAGAVLTITQSGPGVLNIYADPTPAFVYATGCGFGPVQLGCAVNADQVNILSGLPTISGGAFPITQLTGTGAGPLAPNTGGTVNTEALFGSTTVNIDATTSNTNYWRSDITSFTLDLNIVSASFLAPLSVDASSQIETVTPNYSDPVPPTNSLTCVRVLLNILVPCDQQYQVSANTQFFHNAPEPGSLALLGLGLGIAGFFGRRRRAAK